MKIDRACYFLRRIFPFSDKHVIPRVLVQLGLIALVFSNFSKLKIPKTLVHLILNCTRRHVVTYTNFDLDRTIALVLKKTLCAV